MVHSCTFIWLTLLVFQLRLAPKVSTHLCVCVCVLVDVNKIISRQLVVLMSTDIQVVFPEFCHLTIEFRNFVHKSLLISFLNILFAYQIHCHNSQNNYPQI